MLLLLLLSLAVMSLRARAAAAVTAAAARLRGGDDGVDAGEREREMRTPRPRYGGGGRSCQPQHVAAASRGCLGAVLLTTRRPAVRHSGSVNRRRDGVASRRDVRDGPQQHAGEERMIASPEGSSSFSSTRRRLVRVVRLLLVHEGVENLVEGWRMLETHAVFV